MRMQVLPRCATGRRRFPRETVLRYIIDGRDAFSLPAENGAYLCILNRNREARPYSADCSAAGLGTVTGIAPPLSGTIRKLL